MREINERLPAVSDNRKQPSSIYDAFSVLHNLTNSSIPKSPEDEFVFNVEPTPYISPYLAANEILSEFPPTKILTTITDPCLDDCVEFSKKLRSLKVKVSLDVLNGVNHGFLNFTTVSSDCHQASLICLDKIVEMMSENGASL